MSARAKRGIAVIAAAGVICVGAAYVASMVGALVADEPDPYALTRDDLRDLEALSSSTLEPFGSVEAVSEYVEAVRQLRRRREVHYEVPEWLEASDEVSEADDAEGGSGERYGIMGPAENAGAIGVLRAMAGSWNSPISPYGSVTNVQVGGIDEGDIVKTHGHHLVVLRRGRIFTVELENDELRVLDMIDVPPPGVTDGWYDEMLISGDTVLVLSYSYEASASELSLFTIDAQGRLARGPVHYLRSGDYYSSRNYATRLIGQRLIVYTPIDLTTDPDAWVPSVRIASSDRWRPIIDFREVYRPVQPALEPTLHTVIDCDLSGVQIACTARGIAGPWDRTFYVAHDAVYLWIAEPQGSTHARGASYAGPTAVVYRLPLDGSSVGAARVFGAPFDQLCLHRDRGGALNVLVSADGRGDGMWASRAATGSVSLARIPEAALRSGLTEANRAWYMILPELDDAELHARFVGEHVLYGAGESFGDERVASTPVVHVYPYRGGYLTSLALAHDVERIEVMG